MATHLEEVNFSELIQRPKETVARLGMSRTHALRLNRRGQDEDLVLTTAARADQDDQMARVATGLLLGVMKNPVARSTYLLDVLRTAFPWVRFLLADDLATFAEELIEVLDAAEELDSPAAVLQVIAEWRHTAEIYSDPELLAALRSTTIEDHGIVPELEA